MTVAVYPTVSIVSHLADTAEHIAQALPELLALTKGGPQFERRLRPYLNEVTHCLASALEAALLASADAERLLGVAERRCGEDVLLVAARSFLDRRAAL